MKVRYSSILLVTALVLFLAVNARLSGQATQSDFHQFNITAKNYDFNPAVITVKKGEKVRLIITATDRDHGIKIAGYDIDQVRKKGDPTIIEFTADKAGTFDFKCSMYCGMGHRKMKGKLIVEESQ